MFRFFRILGKKVQKKLKVKSRKIAILLAIGVFIIISSLALWIFFVLIKIPSIDNFQKRQVYESTKLYDKTGEILLWEIHGEEKRTIVAADNISRNVKNATIAIEDASFYNHHGFSFVSFFRVIVLNALQGKRIGSGGSTITQQLVKNTLLTSEQTITRKLKEVVISLKLEKAYTKDEILNLYLNEIPYGSNAYGIEAAAQNYFGKNAEEVTLAESAYLAALPNAPTYYSPYGNHRKELEQRKNLVLERMKSLEFITEEEHKAAKEEKVTFNPQQRHGLRAPHFVMYVRELLSEKFGEDIVERGGLKVITTLDMKLQEKAEEVINRRSAELQEKFNASNEGLIAIDPKTGRILAMVGSRDYFDVQHEGNFNITLAHRQPGSAFKPLVYATAFKKGYTPDTVLFDLETNFAAFGTPYIPQNYDEKFRGPIKMRDALAQSLNVPAVKTLYLAGIQDSIETARDFGISTLTNASRYGLTLVLGGGEISPLELTSAYGTFANQGTHFEHHAILEIRDKNNSVVEQENNKSQNVLDPNIANLITNILSDNSARTPAFGARSPLYFESGNVAVKTGTTNDYRDVWTIGYSPNIVVGAWAGNNNNSSMTKNTAGFIITPLWRDFMENALTIISEKDTFTQPTFPTPKKPVLRGIWKGSRSYSVDSVSGKLATEFTPPDQHEERIFQQVHSILYWVNKDNPDGEIPPNPANDPQFNAWEGPVRAWAARMGYMDDTSGIPSDFDTSHSPENWPHINLLSNPEMLVFKKGDPLTFQFNIMSINPVTEASIFIDDEFIRSEPNTISTININQDSLNLQEGPHMLKITVYDSIGNRSESNFQFTVSAP